MNALASDSCDRAEVARLQPKEASGHFLKYSVNGGSSDLTFIPLWSSSTDHLPGHLPLRCAHYTVSVVPTSRLDLRSILGLGGFKGDFAGCLIGEVTSSWYNPFVLDRLLAQHPLVVRTEATQPGFHCIWVPRRPGSHSRRRRQRTQCRCSQAPVLGTDLRAGRRLRIVGSRRRASGSLRKGVRDGRRHSCHPVLES